MDYIYRYIDNSDNQIKYIGRSKRKLDCRIHEHENLDNWVRNKDWKIEYIEVPNQAYSEALEAHFIALYHTYDWYNIAKKDWGIIQDFLKYQFKWKLYSNHNKIINLPYQYLNIAEDKNIDSHHVLVSDAELSYHFEVSLETIWQLAANNVIQPLAKTKQEDLLFMDTDIEKLKDYFDQVIEIE